MYLIFVLIILFNQLKILEKAIEIFGESIAKVKMDHLMHLQDNLQDTGYIFTLIYEIF